MRFEPEPDFGALRDAILDKFDGQTVLVDEIENFVIEDTGYKATHYKRRVLRRLEEEGRVEFVSSRKVRLTYPSGTQLRFDAAEYD